MLFTPSSVEPSSRGSQSSLSASPLPPFRSLLSALLSKPQERPIVYRQIFQFLGRGRRRRQEHPLRFHDHVKLVSVVARLVVSEGDSAAEDSHEKLQEEILLHRGGFVCGSIRGICEVLSVGVVRRARDLEKERREWAISQDLHPESRPDAVVRERSDVDFVIRERKPSPTSPTSASRAKSEESGHKRLLEYLKRLLRDRKMFVSRLPTEIFCDEGEDDDQPKVTVKESARIFSVIPDKVPEIPHGTFFVYVLRRAYEGLFGIHGCRKALHKKRLLSFIVFLSLHLTRRGYASSCTRALVEMSLRLLSNWEEVVGRILERVMRRSPVCGGEVAVRRFFTALIETIAGGASEDGDGDVKLKLKFVRKDVFEGFGRILAKLCCEFEGVEKLFVHSLLLKRSWPRRTSDAGDDVPSAAGARQAVLVFRALTTAGSSVVRKALFNVLSLWRSRQFYRFAAQGEQEWISEAIVCLLEAYVRLDPPPDEAEAKTPIPTALRKFSSDKELVRLCTDGVAARLSDSVGHVRRTAMVVGEKFSWCWNFESEKEARFRKSRGEVVEKRPGEVEAPVLQFDEFPGARERVEMAYVAARESFLVAEVEKEEDTAELLSDVANPIAAEAGPESDQFEFNPDELVLDHDDDAQSDGSSLGSDDFSDDEEEGEVASDADSLESFGLEDDEADVKPEVPKPKYLRSLIPLATASSDEDNCVEKITAALEEGERLVRARPDDLDEVSVGVCKCFLYLNDSYEIPRYATMKMGILKALVVCSPLPVVEYLTKEFYARAIALSRRSHILLALRFGALELSNRERGKAEIPKKPAEEESLPEYAGRTRRWTKRRPEVVSKANRFIEVAERFFHPLVAQYDSPDLTFRLLGEDYFLLAELVTACGTFVHCCGSHYVGFKLAVALLRFLYFLRSHHTELQLKPKREILIRKPTAAAKSGEPPSKAAKSAIAVRRSVLGALLVCLEILPRQELLQEDVIVASYAEWAVGVSRRDEDGNCRELAMAVMAVVKKKLTLEWEGNQ